MVSGRADDPKRRDMLLKLASAWREDAEALRRGEEGRRADRTNTLMKELAQARAQTAEQVAEIARLRLRKPAAAEEHSQARHETSEPR